jgi:hypothetical protein
VKIVYLKATAEYSNECDIRRFCAHQHQTKRVDAIRTGNGLSKIILFNSDLLHIVSASVGYAAYSILLKVDEEGRKRNVCVFGGVERKKKPPSTLFQVSFTSDL